MTDVIAIQPDGRFIRDVLASGGGDLKKCYQCATCSVTCALSPDEAPFPRKQMIETQWGLKERVLSDPSLWLCHNCGDCSTRCPRGARPGDVMGALRSQAIRSFAFPGFMGDALARPALWPLLFALPAAVFGAIALWAPKGEPTPAREFANLFPQHILEPLFFVIAGIVLLAFGVGLARFVSGLRRSGAAGAILPGLVPSAVEILTHSRFKKCERERGRYWGHLLTLWGFAGLALMGTVVGIGTMVGLMHTPLALTNPWKIFANLCAAVILVGGLVVLFDRLADPVKRRASTYFDWFFLLTLEGVIFTGIISELLRLGQVAPVMYGVYFVHLVLIFALFLYAPYSKFAHIAYRTVALAAARGPQGGAAGTKGQGGAE